MIDGLVYASLAETDYAAYRRERDRRMNRDSLAWQLDLEAVLNEGRVLRDLDAERAAVLAQAPLDLKALGVDLPLTRWKRALTELHRVEALEQALASVLWRDASVLMLALSIWEGRGRPGFCAGREDVAEAEMQLGESRSALKTEKERLEWKARKCLWV